MIDWDDIRSPEDLAEQLALIERMPEVACLPPDRFSELFDRVYRNTSELRYLWQLGGAAAFYQHRNPNAFRVPPELPRRLLLSDDVDARVVGLKLWIRCLVSDAEIAQAIVDALSRRDGYESCGGIYELNKFLDGRLSDGGSIDQSLAARLSSALEPLLDDGDDVHSGTRRALALLNSVAGR